MPSSTRPTDFDAIFRRPGVLVVGGHAVNIWASHYETRGDPRLVGQAPFLSKDADIFLRNKSEALALAKAAGWQFRNNPEPRSTVLGHIYRQHEGRELTIDVLRSVRGVTDRELASAQTIKLAGGQHYSIPTPDVMLKAKVSNVATIDQTDRPDIRHVRIMVVCCQHYLVDACQAALAGQIPEREAVDRYMATWRVVRSPEAQRMDRQHGFALAHAIPPRSALVDLQKLPRLLAFYTHQLGQSTGPKRSV